MKNASGVARIRSLCQLGLPAEQFVVALLASLHRLIASTRNLFDFTDADGHLVRYYFEGPIDHEIARHYFEHFHNRREAEVMPSFEQAISRRAVVLCADELNNARFFRSALYNEIWRPQGLHSRIEAVVRDDAGRPLGSLVLYRGRDDPHFTRNDEALLAAIVPYIACALTAGATAPNAWAEHADAHATVVLSSRGELVQASAHALRLLLLAHGEITPETAARAPRREDFSTLSRLWRSVQTGDAARLQPASCAVENAWGRFVFDAEPLLPITARSATATTVQVSIRHQQSATAALRRALDAMPLSAAQSAVAALLYDGHPQPEIATRLGIAPSTVADHVKKIYTSVDVHSVQELHARIDAELCR
ncbi:MAG TPA: helix-turn-helix transcriptional regulator [Burkholderiaceae bacterium]|nr:helix-turn-helix transcriptional regulator [Burkholderiaceae bacterium]